MSYSSFVKIPLLNPIRFHQLGSGDFQFNNIPWFEQKILYSQPFIFGDAPNLQIFIQSSSATVFIDLIDNESAEYKRWYLYPSPGLPEYNGMTSYGWPNGLPLKSEINRGIYFLRLTVMHTQGPIIFYSEPIRIEETLSDCIKVRYWHDVSQYDYQKMYVFTIRIEGGIKSDGYQPGGKFTMYEDLDYNPVLLSSTPFNVYKFQFGTASGIPNYLTDIINRMFSMTFVEIDGIRYQRNEGAKLERQGTDRYAYAAWAIDLIKSENNYSDNYAYLEGVIPLTADTTKYTADTIILTADQNNL